MYYWIEDLFSDATFINVEDGFPTEDFVIPTIAIEAHNINVYPLEMGNRKGYQRRIWFLDIFAENKSQRDDYGYRILQSIEDNIPVYNYDEGFPPSVVPTQIGCLIPIEIEMKIVRVISELVDKLYWRSTVHFTAEYTQI